MEILRSLIIGLPMIFFGFMAVDFVVGLVFHFRNGIPQVAVAAPSPLVPESANVKETPETFPSAPPSVPSQIVRDERETSDVVLNVLRGLTKRELRKILSPLGIQQKRNGVELTTEMAVAQVTRIYKEDSAKAIAVIREKLPDKLPLEPLEEVPNASIPTVA